MPFELPTPPEGSPVLGRATFVSSPGHVHISVEKTYFFSFPKFELDESGNPVLTLADSPTLDPVFDTSTMLDNSAFYAKLLEWSPQNQTDPVLNLVSSIPAVGSYMCRYDVQNRPPAITHGFNIKGSLAYPALSRTTLTVRFIGDAKRVVDLSRTPSSILFGTFPLEVLVGPNVGPGTGKIVPSSVQPIRVYNPTAVSGGPNFGDFTGYFYSKVLSGQFGVQETKV